MTDKDIQETIDKIEQIRGRNNSNWMEILRLAFKYAPKEAKSIMKDIVKADQEIKTLSKWMVR